MDDRVTFDEEPHTYTIDGTPAEKSVTEVVGSVFEQFDPELAIEKMVYSPNWPRRECKCIDLFRIV